jgi:uncharacterized protein DUF3788
MTMSKVKKNSSPPEKNAFAGRKKAPAQKDLATALGATLPLWNQLITEIKHELHIDTAEWHSGSIKLGWSMRLQREKRNIVYLGPRQGWFVAAFALGDKAVAAARKSTIPPDAVENINNSKRYAEGTAVRIDVKSAQDLETVKLLARIKIDH